MQEILRNLARRKLRTGLTVFGIAIGIFALSVMGSLSEFLNTTVESGIRYSGELIRVIPKGGVAGFGVIRESEGEKLKEIAHVKKVSGTLATPAEEASGLQSVGSKLLLGIDPEAADAFKHIPLRDGRLLAAGDEKRVVVGHTIAAQANLKVGDSTEFRGATVEIVGIFQPTQNPQIDNFIIAPLKEVQALNSVQGVVNAFIVIPDDPANADLVADTINKTYPKEFNALNPTELKKQVQQGTLIFSIIILAGAALAVVVGGFATINTMIMSVSERTREIGIKKAVGASNTQIMREFLTESAWMGLLGGTIGISLAKIATIAINTYTKQNVAGLEIFNLTPRLVLLALAFATILGAVAGLIPAITAARMNVVKALRTE